MCVCASMCVQQLPTSATPERNVPSRVKRGKDAEPVAFGAPKTRKSHSTPSWHFIGVLNNLGFPFFLWVTSVCTVDCCHALVNPAPLPFCHSRHGSHYSNTMLRAMQIAISDTTSRSGIFMEKLQSRGRKTCAVNWRNTGLNGQYKCGEQSCLQADFIDAKELFQCKICECFGNIWGNLLIWERRCAVMCFCRDCHFICYFYHFFWAQFITWLILIITFLQCFCFIVFSLPQKKRG